MTVGMSLRRQTAPAAPIGRPASRSHHFRAVPEPARTVALAAAAVGLIEIGLFRIAAPVLSHVPSGAGGTGLFDAVSASGHLALRSTAILGPLALLSLGISVCRTHRGLGALLLGVLVLTYVQTALSSPTVALLTETLAVAAAIWLVALTAQHAATWQAIGVALLAGSFLAGRWPLVTDSLSASGIVVPDGAAFVQTLAEACLVAAAISLAVGVARNGPAAQWAWTAAIGSGVVAAALLVYAPGYTAIVALWSTGVTLSLPPAGYILAIAGLGLVLTEWLADQDTRVLAAGLLLVMVAGITPVVLHHNLTALAGVGLLALAAMPVRHLGGAHA